MHHTAPPPLPGDESDSSGILPFSSDSPSSLAAAVDRLLASLGEQVLLLGLGEPMHGGEEFLMIRNRLFRYLVEQHGFRAIAIESSYPRGLLVNDFISGRGPDTYEDLEEAGFSHGFGSLEANRELALWMREYNRDTAGPLPLRFYGCDSPTEMMQTGSPRQVLGVAIRYLTDLDPGTGHAYQDRITPLLGDDAVWECPEAMMDPSRSAGSSPAARELRIEVEDLITDLRRCGPGMVAAAGPDRYAEALHAARMARDLLTYHALVSRPSPDRISRLLGLRDMMMADTLSSIVSREQDRGRVLVFAHNGHLKCGSMTWNLAGTEQRWLAAGAHLRHRLGRGYAVIGAGAGVSADMEIGEPEPGTIEAALTALPGPVRFVPAGLEAEYPHTRIRSGSRRNPTYFPLTPESFTEFDWLMVANSVRSSRGGPPLP